MKRYTQIEMMELDKLCDVAAGLKIDLVQFLEDVGASKREKSNGDSISADIADVLESLEAMHTRMSHAT